jgi:hypothetical protein
MCPEIVPGNAGAAAGAARSGWISSHRIDCLLVFTSEKEMRLRNLTWRCDLRPASSVTIVAQFGKKEEQNQSVFFGGGRNNEPVRCKKTFNYKFSTKLRTGLFFAVRSSDEASYQLRTE